MAKQVIHRVWTFVIRGGDEFDLRLPRTPMCSHDGGMTVWKCVSTESVANAAKALMEQTGAAVELHTEEQTAEQVRLRQERLGIE